MRFFLLMVTLIFTIMTSATAQVYNITDSALTGVAGRYNEYYSGAINLFPQNRSGSFYNLQDHLQYGVPHDYKNFAEHQQNFVPLFPGQNFTRYNDSVSIAGEDGLETEIPMSPRDYFVHANFGQAQVHPIALGLYRNDPTLIHLLR